MAANKSCTATFTLNTYTLTLTTAGTGSGTVTGAGTYNYNTAVTVTATANTGSTFAGWSGDCTGTAYSTTVTMAANKSCTATFNQQGFTLSMIKSGLGTGVVTSSPSGINCGTACSAVFPLGASVTLTAVPDSGSVFVRWGGICSGITSSISVTMNANKICYAVFNQNFTLTVAKLGHAEGNTWVYGSGTITSTPAGINCGVTCSASFSGGTSVTLTAVPDAGFVFVQWGGSCSGTALMTNILVDTNKICYATFNPSTLVFTLNVIKSGNGGGAVTSSPSGINCGATCSTPFSSGTRVMLMAVPNSGSIFSGWSGACSGTDSSANVAMNANKTCTATFNLITYKLTLGIAGTGQGVVSGDGTYLVGAKVTLGATPNAGSIFAGWSGNADCTDGLVTMNENKTCRATFNIEVGIGGGHKAYWEEYLASYPGASNIQRTPEVFLGGNLLSDGLGRRTGYYTPEGMIRGEGWFKDPVSWTDKLDPIDGVPNTGRCRIEVYHPRRHIGTLRPGHNGGVGLGTNLAVGNVTPKYFTSGLFGSATFVWYLDTGQLTDANVTYGSCTSKKVRKVVWPGEVTDDGWAVIPTSADPNTAKFIFVVPANVDPNTVTIRDIGYGTVIPLPYYKGGIPFIGPNITTRCPFDECYSVVLGGGGGPNLGTDIVNSEGRAKYEWVGDTIRIYITGMGTGGNLGNDSGYLKQLSDGFSDPVAHAVLAFIRDLNISRGPNIKIELYGHSLGAAEATWVYQNGGLRYGDKVFSLGTPFFVNGGDMQSGINGVEYKAYCETLDSICTGSLSTPVTKGRWVNETIIYGAGYRNPHARKLYISILGLPDF